MAQLTLDKAIESLTNLSTWVGETGVKTIREEFAEHNKTGETSASFAYRATIRLVEIYSKKDSSYYVEHGRKAVYPIFAKALHWKDPLSGKDVFAMRAAPYAGDDYVERTVDRLNSIFNGSFTISIC